MEKMALIMTPCFVFVSRCYVHLSNSSSAKFIQTSVRDKETAYSVKTEGIDNNCFEKKLSRNSCEVTSIIPFLRSCKHLVNNIIIN